MKANELCPPPHLEAADLDGKEITVTIDHVGFADVGQESVTKGVVYFTEFSRGLVLNRTNTKKIAALHGKGFPIAAEQAESIDRHTAEGKKFMAEGKTKEASEAFAKAIKVMKLAQDADLYNKSD